MLTFLLLYILYCIAEGYEHARYPLIYHYRAALRRIATGLIYGYLICGIGAPIALYISVGLMLMLVFWNAFDIARNLADGEAILYIGETSSIDKLMRESPVSTWIARFFFMTLSIAANWYQMDEYLIRATKLINLWLF